MGEAGVSLFEAWGLQMDLEAQCIYGNFWNNRVKMQPQGAILTNLSQYIYLFPQWHGERGNECALLEVGQKSATPPPRPP